jgi:hypothetical protein
MKLISILSLLALCIPAAADLDRLERTLGGPKKTLFKKGKGKCPSSGSDSFDDLSELLFSDTCNQIVLPIFGDGNTTLGSKGSLQFCSDHV